MPEKVLYEELTPKEFKERIAAAPIAYLPLGTLEWHGPHLPLGADGLQSQGFFERLAREAGGIVLPMVFLGPDKKVEENGRELYGMDTCKVLPEERQNHENRQLAGSAYWVPEETYKTIIEAILKQLARAGFKIVVGHGHGPCNRFFREHAEESREKFGLTCMTCADPEANIQGLGLQTDHAAANETSLMMALRPELVQMDNLPKEPVEWPLAAGRKLGGKDPRVHASAELGQKIITFQTERMAGILREALRRI